MKKNLLHRLAAIGSALLLSSIITLPAFAAQISGYLDTVNDTQISGWAWNAESPDECLSVEISISSGEGPSANTFETVQALLPREDLKSALGSENHGFVYNVDWTKLSGETFTVTAAVVYGDEKTALTGSYTYKKANGSDGNTVVSIPSGVMSNTDSLSSSAAPEGAVQTQLTETQIALGPGFSGMKEASASPATSKTPIVKSSKTSKSESSNGPKADSSSTNFETAEPGEYLGEFKASGYCNCQKCSGGYTKTYSGTIPKANHTISADLDQFPIGTKLVIDGIVYTVEDKGSNVNRNRIDIFFASHAEALAFGLKTIKVYAPK